MDHLMDHLDHHDWMIWKPQVIQKWPEMAMAAMTAVAAA